MGCSGWNRGNWNKSRNSEMQKDRDRNMVKDRDRDMVKDTNREMVKEKKVRCKRTKIGMYGEGQK